MPALTGARFVAAFGVVLFHYGLASLGAVAPALVPASAAAASGVSFFYLLSGAVLTLGCTAAGGAPAQPAGQFWVRRAARVLPAYLLALGLSVLPGASLILGRHPDAGALLRLGLGLGAALLLVQAWLPPLAAGLNTPSWSVSCEAFFYAVWPRLVARLRPSRPALLLPMLGGLYAAALAAPLCGLLALRMGLVPPGPFPALPAAVSGAELLARTLAYLPLLRLPEFAMGVALGHALRDRAPSPRALWVDTSREVLLAASVFGALSLLGSGAVGRLAGAAEADRIAIESGVLAPLFAALIWQLARGAGLLQRLFSSAPLVILGEASYAVYILQEPLLVWSTALLKRTPAAPWLAQPSFFWCYAGLLVLVSVAVFRWLETPLRPRIARWLSERTGGRRC